LGVLYGETLIVVVKVTVDLPHPAEGADFLRPGFEFFSVVTVGVKTSRTVETEINKGGCDHLRIGEKGSIGKAKGNVVPAEEVVHFFAEEARVTEFKNIPEMRSKAGHKSHKNFPVEGKARRKLEKERTTFFLEKLNPPEEQGKGFVLTSLSFFTWVMYRLAFTAKRNEGGVSAYHLVRAVSLGRW